MLLSLCNALEVTAAPPFFNVVRLLYFGHKIHVQPVFSVVQVHCCTAKSKHPYIEMATSALAISSIGALMFLIPVKG